MIRDFIDPYSHKTCVTTLSTQDCLHNEQIHTYVITAPLQVCTTNHSDKGILRHTHYKYNVQMYLVIQTFTYSTYSMLYREHNVTM